MQQGQGLVHVILGSERGWEEGEGQRDSKASSDVFQITPNPAVAADGAVSLTGSCKHGDHESCAFPSIAL